MTPKQKLVSPKTLAIVGSNPTKNNFYGPMMELGRHATLKMWFPKGSAGSSPARAIFFKKDY